MVDGVSAQCATDLLIAYNQLNSVIPTFFPAPLLGNGQTLVAGVYAIASATTLNLDLILNAQGQFKRCIYNKKSRDLYQLMLIQKLN